MIREKIEAILGNINYKQIGILTSTLDPMHVTHELMARNTIKGQARGEFLNDAVFVYINNANSLKKPSPYEDRRKIALNFIGDGLYLLDVDPDFGPKNLIDKLIEEKVNITRILGIDRLNEAVKDNPSLTYFVHLPGMVRPVSSNIDVRSSDLRSGKTGFDKMYDDVKPIIMKNYPDARFLSDSLKR
ncbi:hypothetical protein JXB27_04265 [Candidatus Woesearchaeota archaeon]|nr:hypothetical protein [Candidatus Woesearchaeota archaeon]